MSANVSNGDIIQCLFATELAPQVALNRVFYRVFGIVGTITDADIGADLDSALSALFKACLSNQATYRGLSIQILRPPVMVPPGIIQRFRPVPITGSSGAGSSVAQAMPGQVRGLIAFYGALARRGRNPRLYMPFPSTLSFGTGPYQPSAGYVTDIGTLGTAIVGTTGATGGSGSCGLQMIDFKNDPAAPIVEDLTNSVARDRWATQRRSGAYGRANVPPF